VKTLDYLSGKSTNELLDQLIKKVDQLQLDKRQEIEQTKKVSAAVTAIDKLSEEIIRFNETAKQEEQIIARLSELILQVDDLLKRQEQIQLPFSLEQKIKNFINHTKLATQTVEVFTAGIQIISEGVFKLFKEKQPLKLEPGLSLNNPVNVPAQNKENVRLDELMSYANTLLQGFAKKGTLPEDMPAKPPSEIEGKQDIIKESPQ